jgi:hypothetical protein
LLRRWIIAVAVVTLVMPPGLLAEAQTGAAPPAPPAPATGAPGAAAGAGQPATSFSGSDTNLSPAQLESLVSRIALYPDDLVAIVLPASTQPLQIVQAQRLLEQKKSDPQAQPPKSWDPSVVALLNYPEVIELMNADLTWTEQLGTSVINQQSGVLDAIQAFRQKVAQAGNLKSDDKRTVTEEKQTIVIQSASPDVIYVPQYNPTTVVYAPAPGYPPPYYYSPPYPYYYSPAATFFAGAVFGAAMTYAIGWGSHGIYSGDVNINQNINVNRDRTTNIDRGNRPNNITRNPENAWKPDKASVTRAQNQRGGGAATAGTRPSTQQIQSGLANRSGGAGTTARPAQQPGQGGLANRNGGPSQLGGAGAGQRQAQAGGGLQNRGGGGAGVGNAPSGGAFSGANRSGASVNRASTRGSQSLGGGGGRARGGGGRGGGRR